MRSLLAGALVLGLMAAAAPPAAEASHRHSRSCGHSRRYDSRGYRYDDRYDNRYDRYDDYRYGRYDDYRYDYRYDSRPYRYSRSYRPYRYYGPSYYRPYYRYPSLYGPYGGFRIGGPRVGVYVNW